ncbi:MAG: hypothetical protein ACERJ2_02645, partial [Filomicrobium sp.]
MITIAIDLLLQRRASPLQLPKLLLVAFDLTTLLNAPALNGSRFRIALKSLLLLALSGLRSFLLLLLLASLRGFLLLLLLASLRGFLL